MTQTMTIDALNALVSTPAPSSGNSKWAADYAKELRSIAVEASKRAPRSQQVHIGPSELGVECDRQVVAKLTREPKHNSIGDPWASIVGTAVHAWLEDAFKQANTREGVERWLTETKVEPDPEHGGTGDLYDAAKFVVGDHKVLGETTLSELKRSGPPRKYRMQLFLYALGFEKLGYRVDRIALIAWPRTRSTLDGMYVWEHAFDDTARAALDEVFEDTARRKVQASLVQSGAVTLSQVPMAPGSECHFCPIFRAGATPGPNGEFRGCPGTSGN